MLILRLSFLSLLFYSILRGIFLLWNWSLYRQLPAADLAAAFASGLRFDLFAVSVLALPAFFVWIWSVIREQKPRPNRALVTYLMVQIPFLLLNFLDVELVQFTGRRFTISIRSLVTGAQGSLWATLSPYLGLMAIAAFFVTVFIAGHRWAARKHLEPKRTWLRLSSIPVILALFLLGARGGVQRKPIGFAHAQVFANPVLNHLALNSSFTLIQSLGRKPLEREHYMSTNEMQKWVVGGLPGESVFDKSRLSNTKQNVVLIILESFSLEHMGKIHGDAGYTPFLDELAEKSLFFPNAFANARRSIEGIGALIGGIPALMSEPFISSSYATNSFFGIGTLLSSFAYKTSFFHGGQNGTMYFDSFSRSAGISRYYGANEYPHGSKDFDGSWGIWDLPFFLNMVQELKSEKTPFFSAVFSLTSHNPYIVPEEFRGRFPKGTSEVHEVVGYTDEALRQFFAAASRESWYSKTLFIITADHTFKPVRPRYQDDLGNYRIPLLFFHPQIKKWPAINVDEPVQQIDVIPSVIDFLGLPQTQQNLLGRSVFKQGPRYIVLASDGFYWLVTREHLLSVSAAGSKLIKLQNHLSAGPLSPVKYEENELLEAELMKKLLATRQYFSEGLWDNQLYFPSGR